MHTNHAKLRHNQDAHTAHQNNNGAPVSRQAAAFICRKQTNGSCEFIKPVRLALHTHRTSHAGSSANLLALATCCTLAVEVTVPYVAAGKREAAAVLDPIVAAKAFAPA